MYPTDAEPQLNVVRKSARACRLARRGLWIGVLNGILPVAVRSLQSIAATLGTMIMGQGLALVIMDAPGGTIADWVSYTLTDVLFGIIPISGLIVLAVVALWLIFAAPTLAWACSPGRRGRNGGFAVGDFGGARPFRGFLSARACSMDFAGLHAERADGRMTRKVRSYHFSYCLRM